MGRDASGTVHRSKYALANTGSSSASSRRLPRPFSGPPRNKRGRLIAFFESSGRPGRQGKRRSAKTPSSRGDTPTVACVTLPEMSHCSEDVATGVYCVTGARLRPRLGSLLPKTAPHRRSPRKFRPGLPRRHCQPFILSLYPGYSLSRSLSRWLARSIVSAPWDRDRLLQENNVAPRNRIIRNNYRSPRGVSIAVGLLVYDGGSLD